VARALIVGCGCRGRRLGRLLRAEGWQVRGTSRSEGAREQIDAAGLESARADPDRPGTILDLCGDVAVVVWLLGSATGEREVIRALHGPRLERLLEKLVDSPVRAFVYETSGTVEQELLEHGRDRVLDAARTWRIPVAFIDAGSAEPGWATRAAASVRESLSG
jgi:nucleoside-diphosphate-sugar epimerase